MKTRRLGNAGLSRIEFICIIVLVVVAIGLAIAGVMYYQHAMSSGDDALRVKTCERVATVNLLDKGCVVSNCDRPKIGADTQENKSDFSNDVRCAHQLGDMTIGYWDAVEKKVFATKPEGYNEHQKMKIGKNVYRGEVNTMVIKVEGYGDKVELSWVKGAK